MVEILKEINKDMPDIHPLKWSRMLLEKATIALANYFIRRKNNRLRKSQR